LFRSLAVTLPLPRSPSKRLRGIQIEDSLEHRNLLPLDFRELRPILHFRPIPQQMAKARLRQSQLHDTAIQDRPPVKSHVPDESVVVDVDTVAAGNDGKVAERVEIRRRRRRSKRVFIVVFFAVFVVATSFAVEGDSAAEAEEAEEAEEGEKRVWGW